VLSAGCKERVTQEQCDALLDRFAGLVVKEKMPGASHEVLEAERLRERGEAARDDSFKNCATELRAPEYRCAMAAMSSETLIKCLE
jgi:hypothetical protein